MAPHSSTLTWKIPWTEEPGRLQSMGLRRVRHDWATSLSLFTFMHWRRKWQPTPVSCLENPRDRGAWRAAVYGVTQSRTRLKRLSSSSSSNSGLLVKNLSAKQEMRVQSLGQEDPLEEELATHCSILAWEIPRTEDPVGYSPWSFRVGHDLVTKQQQ